MAYCRVKQKGGNRNMTKRLTSLVLIVTLMFGGIIVPDSSAVQAASKADNAKKQYKKYYVL